jgi:hypothetical protein
LFFPFILGFWSFCIFCSSFAISPSLFLIQLLISVPYTSDLLNDPLLMMMCGFGTPMLCLTHSYGKMSSDRGNLREDLLKTGTVTARWIR